ncbi:MAG: class I SAM-dependent methyltransferase [Gammaproteobacteria bacterium]|nr:class I SAM-dependent methyltransferase [Gammaproteobacteria bacterium]
MVEMQQDYFFSGRESARKEAFEHVWSNDLNDIFADLAEYYDQANFVASLGLMNWFHSRFIATFDLTNAHKVLDVCTGTHAVSRALLRQKPDLEIHAIDRSAAMLKVGAELAKKEGVTIRSLQGDAHELPFPDNHFDIVTLQFASRHLRIMHAFDEIKRVLKPGGYFYHCDMLRPDNKLVQHAYYTFLKASLTATACIFGSTETALKSRKYFLNVLKMFYSAPELSQLFGELGFDAISHKSVFGGMLGFHKAMKPI